MEIVFDKLCNVLITHNFYDDETSSDFIVEPTNLTKKYLTKQSLLSRQTSQGFNISVQMEESASFSPFKNIDGMKKLSFILTLKNPYFTNFTDLPLSVNPFQVYHLSNRNNNKQNSNLLLSADTANEYVSTEDLLTVKPKTFTYSVSNTNASATVSIADIDDNTVMSETVTVIENKLNYLVYLNTYPPGRYKLLVDGSLALDFYADDSLLYKNIFGIVDIYFDDAVSSDYKLIDSGGDISSKNYYIKFNSRKTYWKYLITLKYRSSIDPDDLSLEYPDSTNTFVKQASTTLSDGLTAVPFISNQEITFSEEPIKGIKLEKSNTNGGGSFEVNNLPNASIKNIKPDKTNNKVYSEIFIYV